MAGATPATGVAIIAVRFVGTQTTEGLVGIATSIADCLARDIGSRVLLDWSEVQAWTCEAAVLPVESWTAAICKIDRAAIVHHHRWNRQAAWLAAVLRYGRTDVRSWRIGDRDNAVVWLGDPANLINLREARPSVRI